MVVPKPDAQRNVLVGYGSVDEDEDALLSLDSGDWDYVAVGHEHCRREVLPGVHYAGALERVGATPWERRRALHLEVQLDDTPSGHLSREVEPSRRLASRLVERLADQGDNFEALVELVQECLPERRA